MSQTEDGGAGARIPASGGSQSSFHKIGQIVSTHGLKGQVRVVPMTDFLDRFAAGARLRLSGDWVTIEAAAEHKNQLLLKLSGVQDITQAEALRGAYLEVSADSKPELEEDEYLTSDLVGLRAVTPEGEDLGFVDDVVLAPAHDVLVIGTMLVPAVKQFVKNVDIPKGVIVLELIEGMRE